MDKDLRGCLVGASGQAFSLTGRDSMLKTIHFFGLLLAHVFLHHLATLRGHGSVQGTVLRAEVKRPSPRDKMKLLSWRGLAYSCSVRHEMSLPLKAFKSGVSVPCSILIQGLIAQAGLINEGFRV